MTSLYAKLKAEKTCPVCGLAAMPASAQQERLLLVRYECGAIFGVSEQLDAIEDFEPCPTPSRKATDRLMDEMALVLAGAA
jgi:hypothetical protein